ncbi:MAG: recombinase family protein [Clostridia bacterium]|nr:recombinase family protein [Clostridia bacterium]
MRDGAAWFTTCKTKYMKPSKWWLATGTSVMGRDMTNETIWGEQQRVAAFVDELAGRRVAVYTCTANSLDAESVWMKTRMLYTDLLGRYIDVSRINFYCEKLSSAKAERPELKRLLDDCNTRNIGLIIAHSPDRFAGSDRAAARIMKELGALKPPVRVVFEDKTAERQEDKLWNENLPFGCSSTSEGVVC